jgi:hypothetical protein
MIQSRNRDGAAVERRDQAQRRLWPITSAVLAGGAMLTTATTGLAWATAPGRAASSTSVASPASTSPQPGVDDGLQPPDQLPAPGGFGGGMPQAVTGGS